MLKIAWRKRSQIILLVIASFFCYFRIDAVNTLGTTAGDVVSFSTWAADDIWTDQDGVPWTDQDGIYIPHERV